MMNRTNIKINRFQLNVLLNNEQKKDFDYLLDHGVFCNTCDKICPEGVEIDEIFLNSSNDIMIKGKCKACGGNVTRIMEFGEDKVFFNNANNFRKSLDK